MIIVQIAGNLGRDPETRFTPSGLKVTNLTVATAVRKGGKDETVWWRVTVWGDRFDKMMSYLKKGSSVIVIGDMSKPEIWTDKEGRPQVNMEMTADIIRFSPFGNPNKTEQSGQSTQSQGNHQGQAAQTSQGGYASQGQAGLGNDAGYNDFGGGSAGYSAAGASSQYGAAQGAATARYNQSIPHNEDQLPF